MFKLGNQDRDTMNAQMGYMTGKMEALDVFIRDHMDKEEAKITAINERFRDVNKTISLQRRYLVGLTFLTLLSQSGMPLDKIVAFLLKLI